MSTVDERFLDEAFEAALDAATAGQRLDVEALVASRPDLRAEVEATIQLALEVAAPRTPGLPSLPGYQVVAELGRGGMGAVYLARQQRIGGRLVALKVLPGADALSERARRRFGAEAAALGRLRHPNVVAVYDSLMTPTVCAYAMEWVEGLPLSRWIDAVPALDRVPQVCRLGLQLASALAAVHRAGLVHRDIKPSNVLVRNNGEAVLVDFGLAREADAAITVGFAGTAPYSPPELLTGAAAADHRSDVYSLGATLYHALTERPPFSGRTPSDLARAIEGGAAPSPRRHNPRVGRDLETIVLKAMAPSPVDRYQTADELADDLGRLLALQPIVARPPGVVARTRMFLRRNRLAVMGATIGGGMALAAAILALQVWQHRAERPTRARAHVERARLQLLSTEYQERLFVAVHLSERPASAVADAEALLRARNEYDAALALVPDDGVAAERAAVVAAAHRSGEALLGDEAAGLPVLAAHAAAWRVGSVPPAMSDDTLTACSERERRALGLFAYLTGDVPLCSRAWRGLDLAAVPDPLIDAAVGELWLQRDEPCLAYPRLEAAARMFPRSGFLRVQLAAAALRSRDVERAGKLLDEADAMAGHDRFDSRHAIRAEWHAARGDVDAARRLFEWMRTNHRVPSTRGRYARWLANRGEWATAVVVATEAAEAQPDAAAFARLQVELVEAWWRTQSREHRRQRLTELAAAGESAWLLRVLRTYGRSVHVVERTEGAIAPAEDASPGRERRFLRNLAATLEAHPMTVTRSSSDPSLLRSLQVSAWLSPWPLAADSVVALLRSGVRRWGEVAGVLLTAIAPLKIAAQGPCVATPPGLVSWWSLEVDGRDLTGTNPATAFGTGGLHQPAVVGNGFRSSGPGNGYSAPDHPSLDLTTLTLEAWVRLDSTGSHHHWIAGKTGATAANATFPYVLGAVSNATFSTNPGAPVTGTPSPGKLFLLVADGSLEQVLFSPAPLALGVFHHVAATLDGGTARMYVDGQLVTSAAQTRTPFNSTGPLSIAGIDNGLTTWPGLVDEVAVYNRALVPAEIQAIHAAGAAGKCSAALWQPLAPAGGPSGRWNMGLASDSGRQRVVLFGGWDGAAFTNDTWEWDGANWLPQAPAAMPPARYGAGMVYASNVAGTVLFGGQDATGFLGDTWQWNGATWSNISAAGGPSPRFGPAMAYDSHRQRIVLFGGWDGAPLGDTWEWNGTNWLPQTPPAAPSARHGASLAFDAARNRVVLFGGSSNGGSTGLNDLWEWDGSSWTQHSSLTQGVGRWFAACAFDPASSTTIVFGGSTANSGNTVLGDTWAWDGVAWSPIASAVAPLPRGATRLVTNVGGQELLLFGGSPDAAATFGDTWVLRQRPAVVGSGCVGPGGISTLSADTMPRIGTTYVATANGLANPSLAVGILGFGAIQLPLALVLPQSAPGCQLLVALDSLTTALTLTGSVTLSLNLPALPSLIGVQFWQQVGALEFDPALNVVSATTTNALALTIGS